MTRRAAPGPLASSAPPASGDPPVTDVGLVAALSIGRYLRTGVLLSGRHAASWRWRILRLVPAGLGPLAPTVFLAATFWLLAAPATRRDDALSRAEAAGHAVIGLGAEWGHALPALLLVACALLLAGRGAFDAALLGGLRDTLARAPRGVVPRVRAAWTSLHATGWLQAALLLGGTLALSPAVAVARRALPLVGERPAAPAFVVGVALIVVAFWLVVGWFARVASVWCVWLPGFFAATLVASVATQVRELALWSRLGALWTVAQLACVVVAASAASMLTQVTDPASRFLAGGALIGSLLTALFVDHVLDATLLFVVGHRLGRLPDDPFHRAAADDEETAMAPRNSPMAFEPPVPGAFAPASGGDGTATFAELFAALGREDTPPISDAVSATPEVDAEAGAGDPLAPDGSSGSPVVLSEARPEPAGVDVREADASPAVDAPVGDAVLVRVEVAAIRSEPLLDGVEIVRIEGGRFHPAVTRTPGGAREATWSAH